MTIKKATQRQGFKTNEFIVYPAHGVGQIISIEEQEVVLSKRPRSFSDRVHVDQDDGVRRRSFQPRDDPVFSRGVQVPGEKLLERKRVGKAQDVVE
jgi:hypothetical protein